MSGGRLVLPLAEPCIDNFDALVSGATLSVYVAGNISPSGLASLFADAALTTPIANPQTSDNAGRFYDESTTIWADPAQAYDCVLDFNNGESFTYLSIQLGQAPVDLSLYALIASPAFTGTPTAPTPASNDNSQKLATTGYVQGQGYATIASPTFTGTPLAPTATAGTDTTQLATTAFAYGSLTAGTAGFVVLPNKFMAQWGLINGASVGSTTTVTFPQAFGTAYQVFATGQGTGAGSENSFAQPIASSLSTTQVQIKLQNPSAGSGPTQNIAWLVIGLAA